MFAPGVGQIPGFDWLPFVFNRETLFSVLSALLIVILTYIAAAVYRGITAKIVPMISESPSPKAELLGSVAIWMIGLAILLSQYEVDPSSAVFLYGAVIAGLIVAFRDILSNAAAKEVLSHTRAVSVGDIVKIGERKGKVVKIGSLYTTILTPDLSNVHIPNSELLKREIENQSQSGTALIAIPITVDTSELDLSDVKLIMMRASRIAKTELAPERVTEIRFMDISGDMVTLELRLHILNPAKTEALSSLIREKINQKLSDMRKP